MCVCMYKYILYIYIYIYMSATHFEFIKIMERGKGVRSLHAQRTIFKYSFTL